MPIQFPIRPPADDWPPLPPNAMIPRRFGPSAPLGPSASLPQGYRPAVPENPVFPRQRSERWTHAAERADPDQRYFLYRLCTCELCDATGKVDAARCPDCRGEGRGLQLVATAGTPQALGLALVTLGAEGEFSECPLGVLDTQGDPGKKWIISPWLPSPRNVSDAGRVLRAAQTKGVT